MYEEMQNRIDKSVELGRITEEVQVQYQHKGFSQWKSSYTSRGDHDTILEVINYFVGLITGSFHKKICSDKSVIVEYPCRYWSMEEIQRRKMLKVVLCLLLFT